MVRAADQKSPREAVEFVLQLLKVVIIVILPAYASAYICILHICCFGFMQYNDNSGNPYSDVFWLAALVQSIGELEFGQQVYLSPNLPDELPAFFSSIQFFSFSYPFL